MKNLTLSENIGYHWVTRWWRRPTCLLIVIFLRASKSKPGLGFQVIATGYPVPKMGNAANH